ncbi:MAG: ribonuclease R [Porphyromonadaceae bacterium]|nr:ribonuclease R [Porphyromonadaceae bacterium]
MGKSRKPSVRNNPSRSFIEAIQSFFNENFRISYNPRQIAHKVGAKNTMQKKEVAQLLDNLVQKGFLIQEFPGHYRRNKADLFLSGIFTRDHNRLYISPDKEGELIYVSECNSCHALSGDKVEYMPIVRGKYKGEAEVTNITQRNAAQQIVGTIEEITAKGTTIRVDCRAFNHKVYISSVPPENVSVGEKVVVRLTDWPSYNASPWGEIIEHLGKSGENNTEMHAILAEFGLPTHYPEELEQLADTISDQITDKEIAQREDFRKVPTFTIDPTDAKDFDDALSLRQLPDGDWEVGVHIADVTYYVKPNTPIDKEAYQRGTSVYLVDRTIPMLPERLCNQICSLRPNEDKFCFSVIFELDDNGKVKKSHIARTVIRSVRRFTYEEAQQVIETGKGDCAEEILALNRLAIILRRKRFEGGAIDFDREEMKFIIDEKGRPISVYNKISKEANKLIEEFMLLANRTVAETIGRVPKPKKPKPFVYRVHDNPDPEKMATLSTFVLRLGLKLQTTGTRDAIIQSINNMLTKVRNTPKENLISTLTICTMAKAIYTTKNIGHYGLAFDYYTHFTSPIRRYPDMMVHRLLERYLNNGRAVNNEVLEERCKHSSDMEQLAANAERASVKYKQAEFLSERMGQVYDGTISGISERGLFVEINENKCEGLVPIRDLEDDYYEFDEKNYRLIGHRTHRQYCLGDPIRIIVAHIDMERRQIDFTLEGKSLTESFPSNVREIKKTSFPKNTRKKRPERKHRK